jgi:hypothetical protein
VDTRCLGPGSGARPGARRVGPAPRRRTRLAAAERAAQHDSVAAAGDEPFAARSARTGTGFAGFERAERDRAVRDGSGW